MNSNGDERTITAAAMLLPVGVLPKILTVVELFSHNLRFYTPFLGSA